MSRSAARFRIEGRVQGVGFRWWTTTQAQGLGLSGWVRNLPDGAVEVLAMGDDRSLAGLGDALAHGPRGAEVTSVQRSAGEDDGSQGFRER